MKKKFRKLSAEGKSTINNIRVILQVEYKRKRCNMIKEYEKNNIVSR